jgi:hypothetical protein
MDRASLLFSILVGFASALGGCGTKDYSSASKVRTLRVLAVQKSPAYGKPDGTVDLTMLYWDGKGDGARPIQSLWLGRPPFACYDPPGDLYYQCFSQFGQASDAGAPAAGDAGVGDAGADVIDAGASNDGDAGARPDGILPPDPILTYSIPIPEKDAIVTRTQGGASPYGLAYVFFAVCAGQLGLSTSAAGLPLGCFDASHNQLGAEDFVAGYSSVYVYESIVNQNPVVSGLVFDGARSGQGPVPHVPRCTENDPDNCAARDLKPIIDRASAEVDIDATGPNGEAYLEQLWVQYYATSGGFTSASKLVNDATQGWNDDHGTSWRIATVAGPARIWAVVHDNRGGVAWTEADVIVDP